MILRSGVNDELVAYVVGLGSGIGYFFKSYMVNQQLPQGILSIRYVKGYHNFPVVKGRLQHPLPEQRVPSDGNRLLLSQAPGSG